MLDSSKALLAALALSIVFALPATSSAEPPEASPAAIPAHNDPKAKDKPPIAPVGTASERAARVVEAIRKNDAEIALPFFFQREPFRQVKGIKNPDRYFDKLLRVYREDVLAMRKSLREPDTVEFVSFELGRQKRWVVRGNEANNLPYYAVYKSKIHVRDAGKDKVLFVRVMITWDDQWYVTHLTNK